VLGLTVRHSTEGLSQVQALRCNTNWAPAFGRVTTSLFLGSGGGSHGRISPPRTSEDQFRCGKQVTLNDLRPGDLVFFISLRQRIIDHVGLYLGDTQFVHASPSKGVVVSSLRQDYYAARFHSAKRIIP